MSSTTQAVELQFSEMEKKFAVMEEQVVALETLGARASLPGQYITSTSQGNG